MNTIKTCKQCAGTQFDYRVSGPHLGQYCADCGTWQRWVPQGPAPVGCMPWGKYQGTPISQIEDAGYLRWMIDALHADVEISAFKAQLARDLEQRLNQINNSEI